MKSLLLLAATICCACCSCVQPKHDPDYSVSSGFALDSLDARDPQVIENLGVTCRVWGYVKVPPSCFRRFDPQCRLRAFRTLAASRQSHPGQTQQSPFRMGKGARTVQHRQGGIRRSPENREMHPDSRPALDGRHGTVRQRPPAPPAGIALRQTRSKPLHGFYSKRRKFRNAKRKHCRVVR